MVKLVTSTVPHASSRGSDLYRGFEDALGRLLDLDLDLDQNTRNTLKEMEPHVWEKKKHTKSLIQNLNAFVQVYEHNTSLSSVIFADRRAGITAMRAFFTYFHFMCDSTTYHEVSHSGDVPTRGTSPQDTRSLCPPA